MQMLFYKGSHWQLKLGFSKKRTSSKELACESLRKLLAIKKRSLRNRQWRDHLEQPKGLVSLFRPCGTCDSKKAETAVIKGLKLFKEFFFSRSTNGGRCNQCH
eukprot:TRINITY_DN81876_c0_g1_i1.p1 TRINITY_DN81876_c0_g1~~TRINITY_DN81876_c0_g1_i1.p1  ORF type:complete len:103 (-),score=13.87 TRINITY_DN81876_c0_g1_i1:530-838(-)